MQKLNAAKANKWMPVPATKVVSSMETVPKIDESLEEDEFQVEIPPSKTVADLHAKTLKVKIMDAAGTELVGHYFDPNNLGDEDHRSKILKIPASIQNDFKNQKLTVAIKKKKDGMLRRESVQKGN